MVVDPVTLGREIKKIVTVYSPAPALKTDAGADQFLTHSHLWQEILVVLAGRSRFLFNGQLYRAEPGTVFLIDTKIPHASRYLPTDHDLVHLWISSCSAMFGSIVYVNESGNMLAGGKSLFLSPRVWAQVQDRWEQLSRLKKPDETLVSDYMKAPLAALVDDYMFNLKYKQQNVKVQSIVKILLQHIRVNNGRDCSWHKLEQITGFSRCYLAHKFKNECGFTVRDYIDQVRVEYSADAISRGCKQKEIASELGFSSPVSFWNWLKLHKEQVKETGWILARCLDSGEKPSG